MHLRFNGEIRLIGRRQNSCSGSTKKNDRIHEFHHGISRELFNRYTGNEMADSICVASALNRGILSREEMGEDVFLSVENITMALSSHD